LLEAFSLHLVLITLAAHRAGLIKYAYLISRAVKRQKHRVIRDPILFKKYIICL
jgi:hypothetical protein